MKKKIRFVWLMAMITMIGIIIFQLYWVYNSYKTEKRNFYRSATSSLTNSINTYLLQETKLNITNSPLLSISGNTVRVPIPKGRLSQLNTPNQPIKINLPTTQDAPPSNLSQMKIVAATLIARNAGKPLNKALLISILREEFRKNNLPDSFKLNILKKQEKLPENQVATFIGFSENNDVLVADIIGAKQYLMLQVLIPALISVLLISFSAASLYYMGTIIRKLMNLDTIKNDFFSNIAHELRTPISILKSTHEALYKFGESSDPITTSRYLQINTAILDKLDRNVDRILDITKYEHGATPTHIEKVNLLMIFKEAIAEFLSYDQSSIQYKLPDNSYVNTDKYVILTILTNLVDNAIKYANKQVNIGITARIEAHHWVLEVKDNGQGIDKQYLPYIFDKFYRVPSGDIHDVKGYGLGLNYVKELVSALNGEIKVKSDKGMGTTFTIKFPNYG